jgi:class 3 adenylate cyclase
MKRRARRQLMFLCAAKGIDDAILDMLAPPTVLHYCGHRIDDNASEPRFPPALEASVTKDVEQFLDSRTVGFAYGSLANGADIIVAEALLDRGLELNVVLPFDADEFDQISVANAGAVWSHRYRSCLERANTTICATDSSYLGDRALFGYAACIAMGHAINRANFLGVEAEQLAVWDGRCEDPSVGTVHDVATWQRTGRPGHIIRLGPPSQTGERGPKPTVTGIRSVRAVLFGDFKGFSRLRDEQFPIFVDKILGPTARVLSRFALQTVYRNSWGDAVVIILTDVLAAAQCALEIQQTLTALDSAALGLPSDLALRMGGHVGAVMTLTDPIRDQPASWGRELTRAARIEPRTPEGHVYVTDAFAALLALEPSCGFATEYVGRVTTAKQFETIPMHRLRRAARP